MFIKFISLFIFIASAYANLVDKRNVPGKTGTSDISQTALGATVKSYSDTECVKDFEFYHPQSGRCLQCSQYCANPETKFCKASCPNYCPDGFRHPILNRCIICSQLCYKDKVLSQQDKAFCTNNCDMNKTRCPDGEFYYQPNDSCLPCADVCGPNKKKGFCIRNCPGYLPKENTREIGLTTIILSAITPAANSIPNSTSPDSNVTFVEFFNQRPYLVIAIIGILVVLLIAAIAGLYLGIILLRKNHNAGSSGSTNDLLPVGVSAIQEAEPLCAKSSLEPDNSTELKQKCETKLFKSANSEQEDKSAHSLISLKGSSICDEAMPDGPNRQVDSCAAIVTLPSSQNSNNNNRIE